MNKDEVFNHQLAQVSDFTFNTKVAGVFDDMVSRSVPFYEEMQRMIAELAAEHALPGSSIYDLGCSTGATLLCMDQSVDRDIKFIGIDDSQDMLNKCREKLTAVKMKHDYELEVGDISRNIQIKNASVVVLCLTLQFVRPLNRERLIRSIYDGLLPGGVIILVEKVLAEENVFNRDFIKYYYNFKRRNHYTELEIAQKREALENVLIPYKCSENITLLRDAGFGEIDIFFKWYNFTGIIAKKTL
ncbi:MAG: carboxy-S-adenosyl-L-methionine synthase CmoA [Chitinophagaceae bacterium]|nr:carboxy-S-adenosyl-L-methionine synthase CmoA [Chitinophagaceae bacterium]